MTSGFPAEVQSGPWQGLNVKAFNVRRNVDKGPDQGPAHHEFHVQNGNFPGPNSQARTKGEVISRGFKWREEVEPI